MTNQEKIAKLRKLKEQAETRLKSLKESKTRKPTNESLSYLIETELEKAELILAAKSISDKLQGMAEDLAKIEADDLMPMLDSLKTAFGPQAAERFNKITTDRIRQTTEAMKMAKDGISTEVMKLEGTISGSGPVNDLNAAPNTSPDMGNDMSNRMDDETNGLADDSMDVDDEFNDDMNDDGDFGNDDDLDDAFSDDNSTAAGRAKKESFFRSGVVLREFESIDFSSNLNRFSKVDQRASKLANQIYDFVKNSNFDEEKKSGLANVLSHFGAMSSDSNYWNDPDTVVNKSLQMARINPNDPEVSNAVKGLRKLSHLLSLHYDDSFSEGFGSNGMDALRESINPDRLVFNTFRRAIREGQAPVTAAKSVAMVFGIDFEDVVEIVKEGKSWKGDDNKKKTEKDKDRKEARKGKNKEKDLEESTEETCETKPNKSVPLKKKKSPVKKK